MNQSKTSTRLPLMKACFKPLSALQSSSKARNSNDLILKKKAIQWDWQNVKRRREHEDNNLKVIEGAHRLSQTQQKNCSPQLSLVLDNKIDNCKDNLSSSKTKLPSPPTHYKIVKDGQEKWVPIDQKFDQFKNYYLSFLPRQR